MGLLNILAKNELAHSSESVKTKIIRGVIS